MEPSELDQFDSISDKFVAEIRAGKSPDIEDYVAAHPRLEPRIRELFPVLQMMEKRHQESDVDLDGSIGDELDEVLASPTPKRLGEYRIINEIGRGGMGIVYKAEQESLGRHVALKLLPESAKFDERRGVRFQQEARASGQLHHSNIVPVFGVGRSDDVSYFVMQYIDGVGLDRVIKEVREAVTESGTGSSKPSEDTVRFLDDTKLSGTSLSLFSDVPKLEEETSASVVKNLSGSGSFASGSGVSGTHSRRSIYYRNIAKIGEQVSDALEYAHSRKILHRDIKPANLLIDQNEHVWVTDFGLAKLMDQDDLTRTGETVGTLRYLPPEQFDGNSDARSDVYSLGLTLYEMLTLEPAFDGKDFAQLLQNVTESYPAPPRKRDSRIPRDLDTIVMKAIAKDPKDRYQSAGAMRDDLRLFIQGKPIRARQASELDRFMKAVKRRPVVSALAGMLLLSLVVGSALVTWKWQQATIALKQAQQESDSRQAINDFLLQDLLSYASPYLEPDPDIKLRTVLDRADEAVATRFKNQPLLEAEIRLSIGTTYSQLTEFGKAYHHLSLAHEIRSRELGSEHPDTMRVFARLAALESDRGNPGQAIEMLRKSIAFHKQENGEQSYEVMESTLNLAKVLNAQGQYDEAKPSLDAYLTACETIEDLDVYEGKLALARLYFDQDLLGKSAEATKEIVEELSKLLTNADGEIEAAGPQIGKFHQLAEAQTLMGKLAIAQGRFDSAIAILQQVVAISDDTLGPDHNSTLMAKRDLAEAFLASGQHEEGNAIIEQAFKHSEAVRGKDNSTTQHLKSTFALSLLELGEKEQALELLKDRYQTAKANLGAEHPDTIQIGYQISTAFYRLKQYVEAEVWLTEILEHSTKTYGPDHTATLNMMADLGETHRHLGKLDLAEEELVQALAGSRMLMRKNHPHLLTTMGGLLKVYIVTQQFEKAEPIGLELIEGYRAEDAHSYELIFALNTMAHVYRMQKKNEEAHPYYLECYKLRVDSGRDQRAKSFAGLLDVLCDVEHDIKKHELSVPRLKKFCDGFSDDDELPWYYYRAKSQLGRAELELKEYEEAESTLLDSFNSLTEYKQSHPDFKASQKELRATANRIRELYKRTKDEESYEFWAERYKELKKKK